MSRAPPPAPTSRGALWGAEFTIGDQVHHSSSPHVRVRPGAVKCWGDGIEDICYRMMVVSQCLSATFQRPPR